MKIFPTRALNKHAMQTMLEVFFGLALFMMSKPYFMWNVGRVDMFLGIIISIIALRKIRSLSILDILAIMLFILYTIYAAATQYNIFGIILKLVVIPFLLMDKKIVLANLYWFKNIFIFFLSISLIVYFFIVVFQYPVGYHLINPLNIDKGGYYFQYPFLISGSAPLGVNTLNIRFSGIFDEPGVVGTYAIILLFADKFNMKSKQNIILLISGIVSFSFFFYGAGAVYYLFQAKNRNRILAITLLALFYFISSKNELISDVMWSRFNADNIRITGFNRSTTELDKTYKEFINSNDLLWGRGLQYAFHQGQGSASYKLVLLAYGLVFVVTVLLAFTVLAIQNIRNRKLLMSYIIFVFAMFINRWGFIFDPVRFYLFIACIYAIDSLEILQPAVKSSKDELKLDDTPSNAIHT